MEALLATYGSDADSDDSTGVRVSKTETFQPPTEPEASPLPPPPVELLGPPQSHSLEGNTQVDRVRSFPHVEGNYALHVFVPVFIPAPVKRALVPFLKQITYLIPGLNVVDVDIPLVDLCNDDQKFEKCILGRELHISLGRTVPIRVHQIDSIVLMLRQKLQAQKGYLIGFNKWEVFVNDDGTRTFLSLEVLGEGLSEITKQIQIVDTVYRLHGLPEFYKNPRPHVSLLWALGDISRTLRQAVQGFEKRCHNNISIPGKCLFTCKFNGIECKIGKKCYKICKVQDQ